MKNNVEKLLEISGDLGESIWNNVFQSLNFSETPKLWSHRKTCSRVCHTCAPPLGPSIQYTSFKFILFWYKPFATFILDGLLILIFQHLRSCDHLNVDLHISIGATVEVLTVLSDPVLSRSAQVLYSSNSPIHPSIRNVKLVESKHDPFQVLWILHSVDEVPTDNQRLEKWGLSPWSFEVDLLLLGARNEADI